MSPLAPDTALEIPSAPDGAVAGVVDLDDALHLFLDHRTRLFRIAHRVTGDVGSAEDVVQETWMRWQRTDRAEIKNPAAFLTTATTHLAINMIQSARHRHETPAEPPLGELVDTREGPVARVERATAVEASLRLMLARLSRPELSAYLLRRGFDQPYADLARLLRTSVPNTRQLVRRAQLRLEDGTDRPVDSAQLRLLTRVFLHAARTGDVAALERLLAAGPPLASAGTSTGRQDVRPAWPAMRRTA
jgi:RNA polymerase sigma-70 factor (ECF subfamily)